MEEEAEKKKEEEERKKVTRQKKEKRRKELLFFSFFMYSYLRFRSFLAFRFKDRFEKKIYNSFAWKLLNRAM